MKKEQTWRTKSYLIGPDGTQQVSERVYTATYTHGTYQITRVSAKWHLDAAARERMCQAGAQRMSRALSEAGCLPPGEYPVRDILTAVRGCQP